MKGVVGAVTAATAAVGAFAGSSVKVGATFDSSMSQVAATMGYTVDELNTAGSEAAKTMEQLRSFAQDMGSSTAFSASEAADALNYMALAGYDATTSMEMLPNVLNLAAAGGIDLAAASDMVTDAQSALGLTLDQTTAMVDQMAATSSKSNTSVAQLGEAMLTIGATARNMAGGTQELSTVLGVLADNGIKGAEGGTHLRNMILSLQNPTDDATAALEKLGIEVYDTATGDMRSMIDIIGDLKTGLDGMDQVSKDAIVSGIFNKTDLAAVNALLGTSSDRFDELSAAIGDSTGAAQAMADVQLDNLQGDITLFKSALEGAQIAISEGLMPNLRDFVKFGTDGISKLTNAFREGGLSGAMSALGGIISDAVGKITQMLPQLVDAGMEMLMALADGMIQNLPLLAQAALEIIVSLADNISKNLPTLIPTIVEVILQIVDTLIDNVDMLVEAALQIIIALAEGLIKALPKLLAKAPEIIASLVGAIIGAVGQLAQAAGSIISTLAQGIGARISTIISKGKEVLVAFKNGVVSAVGSLASAGLSLVQGIWNGISNGLGWIKGKIQGWVGNVTSFIKGLFGIHSPSTVMRDQVGKFLALGIGEGFTREMTNVEKMMQNSMPDLTGNIDVNGNYNGYGYGSGALGGMAINGDVYITVEGAGKNAEEIGRDLYKMLVRQGGVAYAY